MFRVQVLGVWGLVNDILEGQKGDHGGETKMAGWGKTWTSFWRAAQKKGQNSTLGETGHPQNYDIFVNHFICVQQIGHSCSN